MGEQLKGWVKENYKLEEWRNEWSKALIQSVE
jgi:hypothetical protein